MPQPPEPDNSFAEIISSYSRAEAIDDGVLVDITAAASALRFRDPTAITHSAWVNHIATPAIAARFGETDAGRLGDMLNALRMAISAGALGADRVHFVFLATDHRGHRSGRRLWAKAGPGDTGERVLTIMQEGED